MWLCVGWKFCCVNELTSNRRDNRIFVDRKFRDNLEIDRILSEQSRNSRAMGRSKSVPQVFRGRAASEHKVFRETFF